MSPKASFAAVALASGLVALAACRGAPPPGGPLRLGFFPNLTHAQALVGTGDGTFERALGKGVLARQFRAGPLAMEALLAGDLDVCYVGPAPASLAFLRSRGEALRVVAGAVSGGAQLVAAPGVNAPAQLTGRRVASPQLGSSQDVALRAWLRREGFAIGEKPSQVNVTPLASADVLGLFRRGDLAAAWIPEPWGARLRSEAGAVTLLDERDLWEDRRFPSTVVVASARALRSRRGDVVAFLRAHLALTERWKREPEPFARAANARYGELTGHPLPEAVLRDAFEHMEPTADPLPRQLLAGAHQAQALGLAPPGDLTGLVDGGPLGEARGATSPDTER